MRGLEAIQRAPSERQDHDLEGNRRIDRRVLPDRTAQAENDRQPEDDATDDQQAGMRVRVARVARRPCPPAPPSAHECGERNQELSAVQAEQDEEQCVHAGDYHGRPGS